MKGARVLVGAGRTEEPIDPVRVLTNRSSGRMGFALAEAARDRGAEVTLVAGDERIDPPQGVELVRVTSAAEMERAVLAAAPHADLVLMAAAVADYRPARARAQKIKREAATVSLELAPNPDILARARRRAGAADRCSWASRSRPRRASKHAREKLVRKSLDLIVLEHRGRRASGARPIASRWSRRARCREAARADASARSPSAILDRAHRAAARSRGAAARETGAACAPHVRVRKAARSR